jgi:uncharacterized protein YfbU (UPF0304 family)
METKQVTQQEYLKIVFNTALAKSILANQYALHCNEILKHSPYYKGRLKEVLRPCINILINAERKEFEKVDDVDTQKVDDIFKSMENLFETMSKRVLTDYHQMDLILKEYAKRPDEVMKLLKLEL